MSVNPDWADTWQLPLGGRTCTTDGGHTLRILLTTCCCQPHVETSTCGEPPATTCLCPTPSIALTHTDGPCLAAAGKTSDSGSAAGQGLLLALCVRTALGLMWCAACKTWASCLRQRMGTEPRTHAACAGWNMMHATDMHAATKHHCNIVLGDGNSNP